MMSMTPQVSRNTAPHPRDHVVRFYEDDSFLCSTVGRFLLEGYRQGTSAIVIATSEHRLGIESALEAGGMAGSEAKRQGPLLVVDAEGTLLHFPPGGLHPGML